MPCAVECTPQPRWFADSTPSQAGRTIARMKKLGGLAGTLMAILALTWALHGDHSLLLGSFYPAVGSVRLEIKGATRTTQSAGQATTTGPAPKDATTAASATAQSGRTSTDQRQARQRSALSSAPGTPDP